MVMGLDDLLIPLKHLNVKDLLREQLMVRGATYIYIFCVWIFESLAVRR